MTWFASLPTTVRAPRRRCGVASTSTVCARPKMGACSCRRDQHPCGPQCRRRNRTVSGPDTAAVRGPIACWNLSGHGKPLHASVRASSRRCAGRRLRRVRLSDCRRPAASGQEGILFPPRPPAPTATLSRALFGRWGEEMGATNRTVDTIPPGFRSPLVTGFKGGKTVDLYELAQRGVTLLGSLQDIDDSRIFSRPTSIRTSKPAMKPFGNGYQPRTRILRPRASMPRPAGNSTKCFAGGRHICPRSKCSICVMPESAR